MKSRDGKSQRRKAEKKVGEEKGQKRRSKERKSKKARRKKMQVREKVGKSRNTGFFQGGSKSRLGKAAGAEPAGQKRDEKLRLAIARSTCPRKKCRKLTAREHFWKLRCPKSARHCGAKHVSK